MTTSDEITFRPITDDDMEFLFLVYAGTRAEELAVAPWTDDEKEQFLRMQFRAQHAHYQDHYQGAEYLVILRGDAAVGRLYVQRRADEHRVIDIALLPEHRGAGIGGSIMRDILEEAKVAGKPVRIHVEKQNPARRLYDRLGFRTIADVGVYDLLEWVGAKE